MGGFARAVLVAGALDMPLQTVVVRDWLVLVVEVLPSHVLAIHVPSRVLASVDYDRSIVGFGGCSRSLFLTVCFRSFLALVGSRRSSREAGGAGIWK